MVLVKQNAKNSNINHCRTNQYNITTMNQIPGHQTHRQDEVECIHEGWKREHNETAKKENLNSNFFFIRNIGFN